MKILTMHLLVQDDIDCVTDMINEMFREQDITYQGIVDWAYDGNIKDYIKPDDYEEGEFTKSISDYKPITF